MSWAGSRLWVFSKSFLAPDTHTCHRGLGEDFKEHHFQLELIRKQSIKKKISEIESEKFPIVPGDKMLLKVKWRPRGQ